MNLVRNIAIIGAIALLGGATYLFIRSNKIGAERKAIATPREAVSDAFLFGTLPREIEFTVPGIPFPSVFEQKEHIPDAVPAYKPVSISEPIGVEGLNEFTFDDDETDTRDFFASLDNFFLEPIRGFIPMAPQSEYDGTFQKYGNRYGIDPLLLKAIATVESGLNETAKNPADPSYGLMQVYCETDNDSRSQRCRNLLNVSGWHDATPAKLLEADFNVMIAAQILKWNLDTYGYPKGIAVYNAWSARHDLASGPFRNQEYVDKVLREYSDLGGASNEPVFT